MDKLYTLYIADWCEIYWRRKTKRCNQVRHFTIIMFSKLAMVHYMG